MIDNQEIARVIVASHGPGGSMDNELITLIVAVLAMKDADLMIARESKSRWKTTSESQTARAEAAEAQLAEAKKALEAANADLFQFLRRLDAQWFLAQNWFPTSLTEEQLTEAREARRVAGG